MGEARHDADYRRTVRESWIILAAFVVATVWVLAVSWGMGYREDRAIRTGAFGYYFYDVEFNALFIESEQKPVRGPLKGEEVFDTPVRIVVTSSERLNGGPSPYFAASFDVPAGYYFRSRQISNSLGNGQVLAAPVEDGPAHLATVLGLPAWIFWGVMLPWAACTAFTIWFSLYGMSDQTLADDAPDANIAAQVAPYPAKPTEAGHG